MPKYTVSLMVLLSILAFASPVYSQKQEGLGFAIKQSENEDPGIVIQNSANFDASAATLGIRQRPRGKFLLKVRVPKLPDKAVRVRVRVADEFAPHVKVKNKIFKGKRKKSNIVFFMKIKRSVNKLIPKGSLIDVPVIITDLQNNVEEEFILEVRD